LGLARRGLGRRQVEEKAREALARCGILDLASRRPGALSGGQQQRVALARAIAAEPAFLLLDEPFAGLDPMTKEHLFEEISGLVRERSLTLLLVSHDASEAAALCRSVIVLDRGRVLESGPFNQDLRAPRSEILAAFRRQLRVP
jgi:ABC-type sulfate/molybdate transport systems ATPase subunit